MAQDKELPPAEQFAILRHLHDCAACQQELHEQRSVISGVSAHMARIFSADAELARTSRFLVRLHDTRQTRIHRTRVTNVRRWLPIAAIVPVIILGSLLYQPRQSVLQAEELLTRAADSERGRTNGSGQRIQVRLLPLDNGAIGSALLKPTFATTQELIDGIAMVNATDTMPNDAARTIAGLLAEHHYEWREPLSVAHFAMVRSTLQHKRDQVLQLTDANGLPLLALRSTSDEGDLREAELIVERDTFHVVRESFLFAGHPRVEIAELAQWVRKPEPAHVTTTPTVVAAAAIPDRDALDRAELDARWLLGQTGDDLRGGVRFTATPEMLKIEGVAGAKTRRAMSAKFASMPYVRMNVGLRESDDTHQPAGATGATGTWVSAEPVSPTSATIARPMLSRWTERMFGNENVRTKFVPELLHRTADVHQRLEVLADLSRRYRESEIDQLSPAARATLQRLIALHHQEMSADLQALLKQIIVVDHTPKRFATATPQTPADWRRRIASARPHAETLDRLTQELVMYEDLPVAEQEQIGAAFFALWEALYASGPAAS